jgi:uncharacterized coiled-coil protein SlyX
LYTEQQQKQLAELIERLKNIDLDAVYNNNKIDYQLNKLEYIINKLEYLTTKSI